MALSGTLDELARVWVSGTEVSVSASKEFLAHVNVVSGTNTLSIVAMDSSENMRFKNATVVVPSGSSRSFAYDQNGNLTDDGIQTYEWDAENRLVAINYSGTGNRTEYSYDGSNRRVRILEKSSGTTSSDLRYLWNGFSIAEARDGSGSNIEKQYFPQGFRVAMAGYVYVRDHLGSVRAVLDESGVRGLWDYDLWGRRAANLILSGAVDSEIGYTGHFFHSRSDLLLAPFRAYDASTSRWISRDPLGEVDGPNLYTYALNNPINLWDPLGWFTCLDLKLEIDAITYARDVLQENYENSSMKTYGEMNLGIIAMAGQPAARYAPGTTGQHELRTKFEAGWPRQGTAINEGGAVLQAWQLVKQNPYGPRSTAQQRMLVIPKNIERLDEYLKFLNNEKNKKGCPP